MLKEKVMKDRVKELVWVDSSEIVENPFNFRRHPEKQKEVFRELVVEIGVAGAVLCRKTKEGKYVLIDGHMRKDELKGRKIPVLVVDLSEKEAKMLLASYDPVSGLAEHDKEAFSRLTKELSPKGLATCNLFSELKGDTLQTQELDLDNLDEDDVETKKEEEEMAGIVDGESAHVKQVLLFFNTETIVEFEEMASRLGKLYESPNITFTIIECMRNTINRLNKKEKISK